MVYQSQHANFFFTPGVFNPVIMPRKYRTRSRSAAAKKRRFGKKRWNKRSKATTVNRGLTPIAPRFITKLKYVGESGMTSTSSTPALYQFNLNSLYDPDRTGTGHQPIGYDQLSGLYDRYRVFACSWRIDVTGSATFWFTVLPFDGINLASNTNRTLIQEMPRAVTKTGDNNNRHAMFKGHISLPRLRGQTSVEYKGDDLNSGLMGNVGTGSNPTDALTLNLFGYSDNQASATVSFNFRVQLMYHCELYDPAAISQS